MGKSLIDLTGQRFGKLFVIGRDEDYISPKGYHSVQWECVCSCGKTITVLGSNLKKGNTKSCGCQPKRKAPGDLTGEQFGLLTVLKQSDDLITAKGKSKKQWHCKCACGTELLVSESELKNGEIVDCGCLKERILNEPQTSFTDKKENLYIVWEELFKKWYSYKNFKADIVKAGFTPRELYLDYVNGYITIENMFSKKKK